MNESNYPTVENNDSDERYLDLVSAMKIIYEIILFDIDFCPDIGKQDEFIPKTEGISNEAKANYYGRVINVTAIMGKGKTLFATLFALHYHEIFPNNRIYANYGIKNLRNQSLFTFTPFGIIPLDDMHDCLIIMDDIKSLDKMIVNQLLTMIASRSRKNRITMVLTGQYYTYASREGRALSVQAEIQLDKELDMLAVSIKEPRESNDTLKANIYNVYNSVWINAIERGKKHYETKEVVPMGTQNEILQDLKRLCKSEKDIDHYLNILVRSVKTREKMKKQILKPD